MELKDGLTFYEKEDLKFWKFTLDLEKKAEEMLKLLLEVNYQPDDQALIDARELLIEIERWKAGCIDELTGHARKNSKQDVWDSFRKGMTASSPAAAISSITTRLNGFGVSLNEINQHPAKRASAVMRIFRPNDWGVVDWRTIAMVNALNNVEWDIDAAIVEAKDPSKDYKGLYKKVNINEQAACFYNEIYGAKKTEFLKRTADVEMAIFGLTLKVWPFPDFGRMG
jgi:hypothetical protein